MKKSVVSKQELLSASRKIAANQGFGSLNMREIAKVCNVSVGSVYNYFSCKSDLIAELIGEIWNDILSKPDHPEFNSFSQYVLWLVERIDNGTSDFPDFFAMHSIGFRPDNKENGQNAMGKYHLYIKNSLIQVLKKDSNIKINAFSQVFTQEDFIDFVFSNIIATVIKKNCSSQMLLEIINRAIY